LSPSNLTKIYYRIGEVADLVGVEPHVLRYWETEFTSLRPQKSPKGRRLYTRAHIDTLLKVKELLYAHRFTIAGARKKLRQGGIEPAVKDEASGEQVRRVRDTLVSLREELLAMIDALDSTPQL
jgi:DNA-binding transcriptional MerR regulator